MKNLIFIILFLIMFACDSHSTVNRNYIKCEPCEFAEIEVKDGVVFDSDLNYSDTFIPDDVNLINQNNKFIKFDDDIYFSFVESRTNKRKLIKNFDFENPVLDNYANYNITESISDDKIINFIRFNANTPKNYYAEQGFLSLNLITGEEDFYPYDNQSAGFKNFVIDNKLIIVDGFEIVNGDVIDMNTKDIIKLENMYPNLKKGDYIIDIFYFNDFYILGIADSVRIQDGEGTINTTIFGRTFFKTSENGLVSFDLLNTHEFKFSTTRLNFNNKKIYAANQNKLVVIDPFTETIESQYALPYFDESIWGLWMLDNFLFRYTILDNNTKTEADDFLIQLLDLESGNELEFYNFCNDYCSTPWLDNIAYWNGKYYFVGRFEGLY